jgi:hypothetical protein
MPNANESFWAANTIDPKRAFRWILVLNQVPTYVIKTAKKPSFKVSPITHKFIAHSFHYPGRIEWDEVNVKLVDPVFPDATSVVVKILQASGYAVPGEQREAERSFSKKDSIDALGVPSLQQLDGRGNMIEEWTLRNAWISSADFGELSYESEDMMEISLTFKYDWAEYIGNPEAPGAIANQEIMTQSNNQADKIAEYQKELGAI